MKYQIISADCHLDIGWLPANLFLDNAPKVWKERMPQVVDTPKGKAWVNGKDEHIAYVGGVGTFGREYIPGAIHRADLMASQGLYEDGKQGILRLSDPQRRLQDQDTDGVQAEVIYGVLGISNRMHDDEATTVVYQIYNEYAASLWRTDPQRFAGLACIPNTDAELAAAEVRKVAKLGLRGVEFNPITANPPLWHPYWEPLWTAAEACNLPVSFHTLGTGAGLPEDVSPKVRLAAQATRLTEFQLAMARHLASVIFAGVPERHPNLKLVLGESGLGWIPYVLERMDYEWEEQFQGLDLTMKPSEYWSRQIYATYQQDEIGIRLLDKLGEDNIMWGSDFPHPDGIWPDSQTFIQQQLGHLPEATRRKIVCENAAKLYGFPLDA
jgi:predicted TIM-barrel fold metal-dependent hydrolase